MVMRLRLILTAFFLLTAFGALLDASQTLAAQPAPVKGLAQGDWSHNEDRAALGAAWWYAWQDSGAGCADPCVNMSKYGALSKTCPGYLLFLNEPENTADVNLTPAQAVPLVQAQQAHCPQAQLVTGNSTSVAWLTAFLAAFRNTAGRAYAGPLGFHAYCWNVADACLAALAQLPALGYRVWVSEFNCVYCSAAEYTRLLTALGLSTVVDRVAAYTNRQPCSVGCGWVMPGADMVNADGTLTANGQAFRDWQPVAYSLLLPAVGRAGQGYP